MSQGEGGAGEGRPLTLTPTDEWLARISDQLGEIRDRLPAPPKAPPAAPRGKKTSTQRPKEIDGR